jgi:hypothetical protein
MLKLSGLHFLLTYQCTFECDHCFVWGSPFQKGTFTIAQIRDVLQQAVDCQTITEIYFEGGEAFLFYPVLLAGVSAAHAMGFSTGIVSNAYWATTPEDALLYLEPLVAAGLDHLEVSSDRFHGQEMENPEAICAQTAAARLGLASGMIQIDPPSTFRDPQAALPGEPVSGGGVMYRGRAAVRLVEGLPVQPWQSFTTCPYENLVDPGRLHLDPLGYLHLCQGLVMGNLWQQPLNTILAEYDPERNPVVASLLAGGPAALVTDFRIQPQDGYVDACHLCYLARTELRSLFPSILTPDQMYGVYA